MDAEQAPGYRLTVMRYLATAIVLIVLLPCKLALTSEFESALERARQAGLEHRYSEVIEILTPFNAVGEPEVRYITAAEIGRAFFHLGRYGEAHRAFREAVAIHPERAETAIYLEATSYLMGESDQAYAILRKILESGALDLYLAVTLPGERQFLADPTVQKIIEEHAVTLEVDVAHARILGVSLGDSRKVVIETLEARSSDLTAPSLTASAGPALIWALSFDAEQRLQEIVLQAENLFRYTPYRLHFDSTIGWNVTPAGAIAAWGDPLVLTAAQDQGIVATWEYPGHRMTLEFSRPRPPQPPGVSEGAAWLRTVQLTRQDRAAAGRMTE
jgi:tetratricopeptide (TPR) repeat protein